MPHPVFGHPLPYRVQAQMEVPFGEGRKQRKASLEATRFDTHIEKKRIGELAIADCRLQIVEAWRPVSKLLLQEIWRKPNPTGLILEQMFRFGKGRETLN